MDDCHFGHKQKFLGEKKPWLALPVRETLEKCTNFHLVAHFEACSLGVTM